MLMSSSTEFTSRLLNRWAYWQHVALEFSRPGKPVDNTFLVRKWHRLSAAPLEAPATVKR
jgi:hypothetical protein